MTNFLDHMRHSDDLLLELDIFNTMDVVTKLGFTEELGFLPEYFGNYLTVIANDLYCWDMIWETADVTAPER